GRAALSEVLTLGSRRAGGAPRAADRGPRARRGGSCKRRIAMKNATTWLALSLCAGLFCVACGESSTEPAEPAREEAVAEPQVEGQRVEEPAAAPSEAPEVATVGQPAPDFTLTDQAGVEHRLSQYRGRIVVLEWINPQSPNEQRHYCAGTKTTLEEALPDDRV